MRRNLYKITHNQNLHVGVNKISFSGRRHDTVSRRQSLHGFTLTEVLVVLGVMVILAGIAIPTALQVSESFSSSEGMIYVIEGALATARATAIRDGVHAGIRFQPDADGRMYLTYIVEDPDLSSLGYGYRAMEGRKPLAIPGSMALTDLTHTEREYTGGGVMKWGPPEDTSTSPPFTEEIAWRDTNIDPVLFDEKLDDGMPVNMTDGINKYWMDVRTFSIVFSPTGRLAVRRVWVRNKDGYTPGDFVGGTISDDKVFNVKPVADGEVDDYRAKFYQDDYGGSPAYPDAGDIGVGAEHSRKYFIIYDTKEYEKYPEDSKYSSYLQGLKIYYINPYTGEIINKKVDE